MAFKPGQSGNPNGRRAEDRRIKREAQQHTIEVINTWVKWMRSDDPKASIQAAAHLMDRAYGKPKQQVDVKGAVTLLDLLNAATINPARDTSSDQTQGMETQH